MAVIRLKYKRNGKTKTIKRWYIDFTDHNGISRRFPAYNDKAETTQLEQELKNLVYAIKDNLLAPAEKERRAIMSRCNRIRNSLLKYKGLLKEQECWPIYTAAPVPLPVGRIPLIGMPEGPGIYFVWDNKRVVYVGKSKNIKKRLPHKKAMVGELVSFIFTEDLFDTEHLYIGICRPIRNKG